MKVEQDLEEIKERLTQIETKLEQKSTSSKILKYMVIIFLSIFFLLLVIGVLQFVSS
ncbi:MULTISPECIES: hypothetical protein [Paenibacillus]|uniref:hypothetical protein n=1 Tax=Paenibacillus TaxID=44249 RepID=UPI0004B82AD4|nr:MULTISPECIES: hypothetical protein [Paenibacillus]KAF6564619.1 hypothetical protein G9G63_10805 [Paenibacillus sp. EKM202P]KAF6571566.1 hypothetical protein G9G64_05970 [Paenibacillus sp. EKM207P]